MYLDYWSVHPFSLHLLAICVSSVECLLLGFAHVSFAVFVFSILNKAFVTAPLAEHRVLANRQNYWVLQLPYL